jgi:hypothetical protein
MPRQAVVSPLGPLRIDDTLKTHLEWAHQAADVLGAVAIRFETPATLTPSRRSRELLAAYVEQLPKGSGRHWVWTYTGLWEPIAAFSIAQELGLICSFDPLAQPFPRGQVGYAYLKSLGTRSRLSAETLGRIVANLNRASIEKIYLALDSASALSHVQLLQKLVEAPAETSAEIDDLRVKSFRG